jgi:thiosulfate/3-mercaptopyruvate sulfurtransferase
MNGLVRPMTAATKVFWTLVLALGLFLGAPLKAARAVPGGGYAHPAMLIQPEELQALLTSEAARIRIIDFRHKAKYFLGHLPGAVQVWRRETEDRSQQVPEMPASREQIEQLLGRLGVSSQTTVVIYSDRCDHTRLWWILARYGFPLEQLKLLDGGLAAWRARGYPTHFSLVRYPPTVFKFASPGLASLEADLGDVKAALARPGAVVLDVRPKKLYDGQNTREGAARPGHIPGAVSVFWEEARASEGPYEGYWKSAAAIRKIYTAQGVTPEQDVYIYGHTGLCAAYTLASLYLAGYPLAQLHVFTGSWIAWSRSREPVAAKERR